MRGLLFFLVLLLIVAGAAPYIDGLMFKRVYEDHLAVYQTALGENMKVELVDYRTGWMKSTAKVKVTVTDDSTSSNKLPPQVFTADSVIQHGPLGVDPKTGSFTFAYAVVTTNLHFPDALKVFIPDSGNGYGQVTSVVDFDGKTWRNHFIVQPVDVMNKVKWSGITGDSVYVVENKKINSVEGTATIGLFTFNGDNNIPDATLQPMTVTFKSVRKGDYLWEGSSQWSAPKLTLKWEDGRVAEASNLISNSTYGFTGTNAYSYKFALSLDSLTLPATLPVKSITVLKDDFSLNNLDANGIETAMKNIQKLSDDNNPNPQTAFPAILDNLSKTVNQNSHLDWLFSANTDLGNTMLTLKLTLQATPATKEDVLKQLNVNLNARAAVNLVETIITYFFTKETPDQTVDSTVTPAAQQPDPMEQQVAQLVQTQKVSLNDSLTIIGYLHQNLSSADFNQKISAMTSLDPAVIQQLQTSYAAYLANKQKMAEEKPAVTPTDPTTQMRRLVDMGLQKGYIVKDNNDYVVTFTKQGDVYTLNGKDVSAEFTSMTASTPTTTTTTTPAPSETNTVPITPTPPAETNTVPVTPTPPTTTSTTEPVDTVTTTNTTTTAITPTTPSTDTDSQANAVITQIQSITAAADQAAKSAGSYDKANLSNQTISTLLPPKGLLTPWGTQITIGTPSATSFPVTIPQMPADVCPTVKQKLLTNEHYVIAPVMMCKPDGATDFTYTYVANP